MNFNKLSTFVLVAFIFAVFLLINIDGAVSLSISPKSISYGNSSNIAAAVSNPKNYSEIAINNIIVSKAAAHGIPNYYTFYGYGEDDCNQTISAGKYNVSAVSISAKNILPLCSRVSYKADLNSSYIYVKKAFPNLIAHVNKVYNYSSSGLIFNYSSNEFLNPLKVNIYINGNLVNSSYVSKIINTINVANGTLGMAILDNKSLYVAGYYSSISKINLSNVSDITPITKLYGSSDVALINNSYAYVTNSYNNTLALLDLNNDKVVNVIKGFDYPVYVAISPNGKLAYVSNIGIGNSKIYILNISDSKIVGSISKDLNGPFGIAFSPNGKYIYVVNGDTSTLEVFNSSTYDYVTDVPLISGSESVSVAKNGDIFIAGGNNFVEVLNPSLKILSLIKAYNKTNDVVIDNNLAYISTVNKSIDVFKLGNYSYTAIINKQGNNSIVFNTLGNENYTNESLKFNFTVKHVPVNVTKKVNVTTSSTTSYYLIKKDYLYIKYGAIIVVILVILILAILVLKRKSKT